MNKRQMKKHAKKFLAVGYYGSPAGYSHKLYGVFPLESGNWEAVFVSGEYPDTWYITQTFNRRGYCRG